MDGFARVGAAGLPARADTVIGTRDRSGAFMLRRQ
jgi:hypothetical protein